MAGKFVPICGAFSADTVYCENVLVARDVSVTLPEVAAVTSELQATGPLTMPDWSRVEHMETTITRIGVDKGLRALIKPGMKPLEFRGVQPVTDAQGNTRNVGVKAFIKGISTKIPGISIAVGDPSENEATFATTRYQLFVDGEEMWLIDKLTGQVRIDGIDYADNGSLL